MKKFLEGLAALIGWLIILASIYISLGSCKAPSFTTEKPKYGIEIKCDTTGCKQKSL